MIEEPKIHSHILDVLPHEHPRANEDVHCVTCKVMLHCWNNECMQTWVETGIGDYCLACFATQVGKVLSDQYALGTCPKTDCRHFHTPTCIECCDEDQYSKDLNHGN